MASILKKPKTISDEGGRVLSQQQDRSLRILMAIPHVFNPTEGSLYSSQTESKRLSKQKGLIRATIGNLTRHSSEHWIHASLGKDKPVVNREMSTADGVNITIMLFTAKGANLIGAIPGDSRVIINEVELEDYTRIPFLASKKLFEMAKDYDMIGYIEDDILIEDREFFRKLHFLQELAPEVYAFLPHRCEEIENKGDVILSGDPDGGRPDLFWATSETIEIQWPTGNRRFYRATNPHSGCYFLSRRQAHLVKSYWEERNWISSFVLSGPLEQAASGMLLPVLRIMKPVPEHYRFLMVSHQDELWRRHAFESRV